MARTTIKDLAVDKELGCAEMERVHGGKRKQHKANYVKAPPKPVGRPASGTGSPSPRLPAGARNPLNAFYDIFLPLGARHAMKR